MPGASHRLTPQEFLDLRPAADRQANLAVGGVVRAEPPGAELSAQCGVSGALGGLERAEVAGEGLHAASLADRS